MTERFEDRYYQWARDEWSRELDSGLARLRALRSSEAMGFVRCMDALEAGEQRVLVSALLKRFHPAAVARAGQVLSQPEELLWERFRGMRLNLDVQLLPLRTRLFGARRPRNLRGSIEAALDPMLGLHVEHADGRSALLTYRTPLSSGYTLVTHVDMSGRVEQLSYGHSLLAPGGGRPLAGHLSLFSWLGIRSDTNWDQLTAETAPEAVEQLRALCEHFLAALPALLE